MDIFIVTEIIDNLRKKNAWVRLRIMRKNINQILW